MDQLRGLRGYREVHMEREASFYEKRDDGRVQCRLCPHNCIIAEGKTGICRVRVNRGNVLYTAIYGEVSSVAMDPIEKKPLYHFFPGNSILSIGTVGCSFRCKFCQNYSTSQNPEHPTQYYSPEELVSVAGSRDSIGIAYTYTEPLIWYEYVLDCCKLAHKAGLKNVFVSNGYINPEPLGELLPFADAFNIDLKGMNMEFYRKVVGGTLQGVLDTISEISKHPKILLEVTTLVIPGYNDSDAEMEELTDFLSSLRVDIPYHLSAYFPMYQFTAPATPFRTLERLREVALKKMRYVYLGNVSGPTNTVCHNCGAVLVERHGYSVRIGKYSRGTCENCGTRVPIIG
jgi:pyruvate formate lyase activating enzyme